MFLTIDQVVSSKRGEAEVGQMVPCRVWRDVVVDAIVAIKADTLASCRIDKIRHRNIGGFEGRLSIAGVSATTVDGQSVLLQGGYNKEGSGRKAVVWTVGLLLVWPALFVPGGAAELPPGTVFDVSTVNTVSLSTAKSQRVGPPRLDLSGLTTSFAAEILLDEFLAEEKPDVLKIKITSDESLPSELVIDNVNGKPVAPLVLSLGPPVESGGVKSTIAETRIKPLAKFFQKGINRFEVTSLSADSREAVEVILDVQM